MKLRNRILLPVLTVMLIALVLALSALSIYLSNSQSRNDQRSQENLQDNLRQMALSKAQTYGNLFASLEQRALEQASLFSQSEQVIAAYRLALTGNPSNEDDPACREARAQ